MLKDLLDFCRVICVYMDRSEGDRSLKFSGQLVRN